MSSEFFLCAFHTNQVLHNITYYSDISDIRKTIHSSSFKLNREFAAYFYKYKIIKIIRIYALIILDF